jgi:hypothetical protein
MRRILIAAATLALAGLLLATTSAAVATPSKSTSCSGCHGRNTAVKISVTRVSRTSTTVKYSVKVTGGSGTAAWAVLSGGKNIARRTASTGTFKVAKGKIIKVWAVKKNTGANYKSLTAK